MSDHLDNRQAVEAGQYFDIWRLLSAPRSDNEAVLRSLCRSVYLGNDTALCRVLGRYKMYVDTRDVSISSHLMLEGYWEMWVTEAMMRHVRPGMTVLDIGANLGYFTMLLADLVGPAGRVLAFEPNPEMAGRLRRSIGLNGFAPTTTLHEVALGASDGVMLLEVNEDMPGGAHLVAMPEPQTEAPVVAMKVAVPAKTMPALTLPELPRLPPLPPMPDWQPRAPAADSPAWPRPAPVPPVVIAMPPAPPAPAGMLAWLAARLGFVRADDVTATREAAQVAIDAANAEINTAAQVRVEAAIVEAIAAGEAAAGARIAASEAAGAARAAADAARAMHAEAGAATRAVAEGALAMQAEAIAAMQATAEAARASHGEAMAALAAATVLIEARSAEALAPRGPGRSFPTVPVRRLDEIPGAIDADFIKMDVEGAEQMVWSGMTGLLAKGKALTIFMEFTIQRFADPHGFLDQIFAEGFDMAIIDFQRGIVPIRRDELFALSHAADHMLVFTRPERPAIVAAGARKRTAS